MVTAKYTEAEIREWLKEVVDPEIPVISLLDLGVINKIEVDKDSAVLVELTPTFVGCPATNQMKLDVEECLASRGVEDFDVRISMEKPWSSNQISELGKQQLKEFGLAPPQHLNRVVDLDILERTPCPYCDSEDTELKNPFGPTLCRAIHYCHNCQQAFEQFKPVG